MINVGEQAPGEIINIKRDQVGNPEDKRDNDREQQRHRLHIRHGGNRHDEDERAEKRHVDSTFDGVEKIQGLIVDFQMRFLFHLLGNL